MTIHKVFYYCQSFHFVTKDNMLRDLSLILINFVVLYSEIVLIHEEFSARIVIFWYNEGY